MNLPNNIVHKGIIQSIRNDVVYISFTQQGACAGCSARSACSMVENLDQILELPCHGQKLKAGDEVNVSISANNGYKAVLLSYFIPLIILVVVLTGAIYLKVTEPIAGLLSILSLVPYFLVLKLFHKNFKNDVSFEVLKQ
jgi:positive regulator of sigma E activity